jgi:hypothetical protein
VSRPIRAVRSLSASTILVPDGEPAAGKYLDGGVEEAGRVHRRSGAREEVDDERVGAISDARRGER